MILKGVVVNVINSLIKYVIFLSAGFTLTTGVFSQSLTINENVPIAFGVIPPTIPGEPPVESYENVMGDITITPDGGKAWEFGDSWYVTVSKSDITWDSNMLVDVKRAPNAKLIGGTTYIQIPDSPTASYFFETTTNTKKVQNLDLQHRVRTVGATPSAGNYTATIIYTIVDM